MAKADRLERLDMRRIALEAAYRAALVAALRRVAGGSWGLFGHNKDKAADAAFAPAIEELIEMGEEIDMMRDRLAMEAFGLHAEFLAARGPVSPSAVGEPKQARAWLERLAAEG